MIDHRCVLCDEITDEKKYSTYADIYVHEYCLVGLRDRPENYRRTTTIIADWHAQHIKRR